MSQNYLKTTRELLGEAESILSDEKTPDNLEEGTSKLYKARALLGEVNGLNRLSKNWRQAESEYQTRYSGIASFILLKYDVLLDDQLGSIPVNPKQRVTQEEIDRRVDEDPLR